jgi:thiol:disulfide interchange protein DsbD
MAVVWVIQRSGPPLLGWGKDLEAALKQAAEGGRRAVILFHASPSSQTTRNLIKRVLGHSETKKALEGGKFIRVRLKTSLGSPVAKKYKIQDLPTVVVVDSEGKELNRRVGYISFADFRAGFLDCTQIVNP